MSDMSPREEFQRMHLGEPWQEIDTADHVHHEPTGEDWVVAYVRDNRLSACGWPDTMVDLRDCRLTKKATRQERLDLLKALAKSTGHRAAYALHELDRIAGNDGVPVRVTAAEPQRNEGGA